MVLAKSDILGRLKTDLIITPLLHAESQIGEASVDLRLGREFIVTKHTRISSLDPIRRTLLERTIPLYQEKLKLDFGRPYILHPQELVLASTLEFLAMPKDLMAYVVGRSSWGRLGLIIATATMVDPLYRGVITLELVNVGRIPIHLYPCARIAQIVLHHVPHGNPTDFDHKYQDSFEPSFSKVYLDKELPQLIDQPFLFAFGLTGPRGAGKSHVLSYLTLENDFRMFNISDRVRAEAKEQGLELDRTTLQDWGDEQRRRDNEKHGQDKGHVPNSYFARMVCDEITEKCSPSDKFLVITGIRNPGEVAYLRKRIRNFFLIAITADADVRYERREDGGEHQERSAFDECDKRDLGIEGVSHGQDIGGCIEIARKTDHCFVIDNGPSVSKQDLCNKVEEILVQTRNLSNEG